MTGEAFSLATGGRLPTVRECVTLALAPSLSITRSPMFSVPAVGKLVVSSGVPVWVSYLPLPFRSHWYSTICPSGALEPDAFNVTLCPGRTGFAEIVNAALGALTVP